jgi:hypothetical protein
MYFDEEKITCDNCGSVYQLMSEKVPYADADSINCEVCSVKLYSWRNSKEYKVRLLERKELHLRK